MHRDLPADLKIIRHPRATRFRLRLDRRDGRPVLTLPPGVSERSGLAFVRQHLDWLDARRAARPQAQPFVDGMRFPLGDGTLRVVHRPASRGAPKRGEDDTLVVGGAAEHLNRRVVDWLRAEATRRLKERVRLHAAAIGETVARVRVADQSSRWGSCSGRRVLSFNWRLVFAPATVLDYVAAHEVAHLKEMNHGPAFHRWLARLHPDPHGAGRWLDANGATLRRYGLPTAASMAGSSSYSASGR
ncbi:MAG: SprT family zinc-dependent metalloprotease [Pseudomonadota bacterium]|nr:SprT family zinc-dependent metalloprotease [Pseudomonadota bacterium]